MANNLLDGAISHWKHDEATGVDRVDDLGGYTATNSGSIQSGGGKIDNASVNIAASSHFLTVSNVADLRLNNTDFTLAGWFNRLSTSTGGNLIGLLNDPSNRRAWAVSYLVTDTQLSFAVDSDGTPAGSTSVAVTGLGSGIWFHWVATYNSSTGEMKLYVTPDTDSEPASPVSTTHSGGIFENTVDDIDMFRGRFGSTSYYHGALDEVSVSHRVWDADDVADHFNGGSALPVSSWELAGAINGTAVTYLKKTKTKTQETTNQLIQRQLRYKARYGAKR